MDVSKLTFDFTSLSNDTLEIDKSIEADNWFEQTVEAANNEHFSVLHLNLNSSFNKNEHIKRILNTLLYEIVMFNESKLDKSVPNNLNLHEHYNLLRRDRNRHGGGILVYVKKSYKITEVKDNEKFE